MRNKLLITTAIGLMSIANPAFAESDIELLKKELQTMRTSYEGKIASLEGRIRSLESTPATQAENPQTSESLIPPAPAKAVLPSSFNPSIGVVLNGQYGSYSKNNNEVAGFATPHEGERGGKGFSLGESEVYMSANVDDLFSGTLVTAFVNEEGEDAVEIEEAFIQTIGLPHGLSIKAGRTLANLGYMNEKHAHTDDFVERSLPHRVFLNNAFNDTGAQVSWVLPTDLYTEIGAGLWGGNDFPGADAQTSRAGSYSAYGRTGGDIGDNQTWRLGLSYLGSKADGGGRETGEPGLEQVFTGDNDLIVADARYTYAPTGNAKDQEISLQGEYFRRKEKGEYADNDAGLPATPYDGTQSGWYAQGVYKFHPEWRVGARYTALTPDDDVAFAGTALDSSGHDPHISSFMTDYTPSEFSRVRLQYNHDNAGKVTDHQFLVQYIMSLGAHAAHKY